MKFTGRIKDIGRTLDGSFTLTLDSRQLDPAEATGLMQMESLDVEIKKHRKRRSLDANAYAWVLMGKIAEAVHSSKEEVYEEMLRRYGKLYEDEDGYITVTVKSTVDMAKIDGHWLKIKDNGAYAGYAMIKGSSRYDTAEMSHFIDDLITECKELGIETLPPEELLQMLKAWSP